MSESDTHEVGPDPSWTAAELLDRAEACTELSVACIAPLSLLRSEDLDPDQRLQLALVTHRLVAVIEAVALRALAGVPDRTCRADGGASCPGGPLCAHRWETDELAALTRSSRWEINQRRSLAADMYGAPGSGRAMAAPMQRLASLLETGQLQVEHLRSVARALRGCNDVTATAAVDDIAGRAGRLQAASLRAAIRRAVARRTPPAEAKRAHEQVAREDTGISFFPMDHGLAGLTLIAPVVQIEAIRRVLDTHPDVVSPAAGDTRTIGQRRADLLTALVLGSRFAAAPGGRSPAVPVSVVVTASYETLAGLSNEPGAVGDTLVDASLVRAWTTNPHWARRVVLDEHGVAVDLGRKLRFPNRSQQDFVRLRYPTCTFPGCPVDSRLCDIDHVEAWADGGSTDLDNLQPLCPRHHRLKHHPDVSVELNDDGSVTWTLPSRRMVRSEPVRPDAAGLPDRQPPDLADFGPAPTQPTDFEREMSDTDYQAWLDRLIAEDERRERALRSPGSSRATRT